MNREQCVAKSSELIARCSELRAGNCDEDYEAVMAFKAEVKSFIADVVVDSLSWHQAIDSIWFNTCSGPLGFGSAGPSGQEAFVEGFDRLKKILEQFKIKFVRCSERDMRWNIAYDGGVE